MPWDDYDIAELLGKPRSNGKAPSASWRRLTVNPSENSWRPFRKKP